MKSHQEKPSSKSSFNSKKKKKNTMDSKLQLKIGSININGLNKKKNKIIDYMKRNNLDILCIQETHKLNDDVLTAFQNENISFFPNASAMERNDYSGTAFLVNHTIKDQIYVSNPIQNRMQTLKLSNNSTYSSLTIFNIYAPSDTSAKKTDFYKSLESLIQGSIGEIMLLGDFNNTILKIDNRNGLNSSTPDKKILKRLLSENILIDSFRHLYPRIKLYTKETVSYGTRIDRIYVSKSLTQKSLTSGHYTTNMTDHKKSPYISILWSNKVLNREHIKSYKNWKINNQHLNLPKYESIINHLLTYEITKKQKYDSLLHWWDQLKNKIKKASITFSIKHKKEMVSEMNSLTKAQLESQSQIEYENLQHKIENINLLSNEGARVRAKITEIDCEIPTKSFFTIEEESAQKKQIKELYKNDGSITKDKNEIESLIFDKFHGLWGNSHLLTSDMKNKIRKLTNTPSEPLQDENKYHLISLNDLDVALKSFKSGKSPGPDGLSYEFTVKFWPILKYELLDLYNNCLLKHTLPDSLYQSNVVLIPKKGDTKHIKNWRPISLINFDYKLLAKIICNRLKNHLPAIISWEQKCGVPERRIEEALYNIQSILQHSQRHNKNLILLSIDQEKAFDKISQPYIFEILKAFNIPNSLFKWIQLLYLKPSSKIQINNSYTKSIRILSGIRQGCPLSMALYVMGAEILNRLVKQNLNIIPYKIGKQSIYLTQYADDTCFCIDKISSIQEIIKTCNEYGNMSGQSLNLDKTCATATNDHIRNMIKKKFQKFTVKAYINILGFEFNLSNTNNAWTPIPYQIKQTLEGHLHRNISLIGKVTLLNTLVTPKILQVARLLPIPKETEKHINSIIFKFLWHPNSVEQISRLKLKRKIQDGGINIINVDALCKSALMERLTILAKNTENTFPDIWIKHAKMELGTNMRKINKDLFRNNELHYHQPSSIYAQISKWLTGYKITNWGHYKLKNIKDIIYKRTENYNLNNEKVLISKKRFFDNNEKETAIRINTNGYLWGSWRKSVGYTANNSHNCSFCSMRDEDDVHHLLLKCPFSNSIWNDIKEIIQKSSSENIKINKENIINLELNEDNLITEKIISITRTCIINKKLYLENKKKTATNQNHTKAEILFKIKCKMKNFLTNFKPEINLISTMHNFNLTYLFEFANPS